MKHIEMKAAAGLLACFLLTACGDDFGISDGAASGSPSSSAGEAVSDAAADTPDLTSQEQSGSPSSSAGEAVSDAAADTPGLTSQAQSGDTAPETEHGAWKGKVKTRTWYYYLNGELVDQMADTYEYNENGDISRIGLTYHNESWLYKYDDHRNVTEFLGASAAGNTSTIDKYELEYYDDGTVSKRTVYSCALNHEPEIQAVCFYDKEGRLTEYDEYLYTGGYKKHTIYYDCDQPNTYREIEENVSTDYQSNNEYVRYVLPNAEGKIVCDYYLPYLSYAYVNYGTDPSFTDHYRGNVSSGETCTYDDHGNITGAGGFTYEYAYSSSGMLLKLYKYKDGAIQHEYEYDGNGLITREKGYGEEMPLGESMIKNEEYNEIVYEYEFY